MTPKPSSGISDTAWIIAYRRTFTDLPYVRETFEALEALRFAEGLPRVPESLYRLERAPLFEARYKLVSALLAEIGGTQYLELAAGYSQRGVEMTATRSGTRYVELDLAETVAMKEHLLASLSSMGVRAGEGFFLESGSALSHADLERAARHFDDLSPITVLNEGLLAYLTFDEKKTLAAGVHALLRRFGGAWITPDVVWPKDRGTSVGGTYTAQLQAHTNTTLAANAFRDEAHAREFFESMGFAVTSRSFAEVSHALVSPGRLGLSPDDVANVIGDSVAFILTVK